MAPSLPAPVTPGATQAEEPEKRQENCEGSGNEVLYREVVGREAGTRSEGADEDRINTHCSDSAGAGARRRGEKHISVEEGKDEWERMCLYILTTAAVPTQVRWLVKSNVAETANVSQSKCIHHVVGPLSWVSQAKGGIPSSGNTCARLMGFVMSARI
ncbi:hypothetical protein C8R45DRAFT_943412 [Mycena sanguinolenta]|nr:hypothetical protein C8R45DRAFT_943412 [Mycena sanguinolenta]